MSISFRTRRATVKPPFRARATTIAIWIFAIVEAIGIGYVLWTY
jgi:hypothetical protein